MYCDVPFKASILNPNFNIHYTILTLHFAHSKLNFYFARVGGRAHLFTFSHHAMLLVKQNNIMYNTSPCLLFNPTIIINPRARMRNEGLL